MYVFVSLERPPVVTRVLISDRVRTHLRWFFCVISNPQGARSVRLGPPELHVITPISLPCPWGFALLDRGGLQWEEIRPCLLSSRIAAERGPVIGPSETSSVTCVDVRALDAKTGMT